MTSKNFALNSIVSVLADRLLCSFGDYRDLINHMTGTDVPLWQISATRPDCAARLTSTFPELATIPHPPEKTDSGNANKYVRQCSKAIGGIDGYDLAEGTVKFAELTLSEALYAK